jgi:glycosyltransferase involved in cell wall biosynthesis
VRRDAGCVRRVPRRGVLLSRLLPSLSIVIPAFNEEARLPWLLEHLDAEGEATVDRCGFRFLEAVIVDDGSDDRTAEILSAAGESEGPLRPVLGAGHRGKGAAVATGLRAARGDYSLLADADLSTPLADLVQLGEAISDGADIAIGSREVEGSRVEAPAHRRRGGRLFNAVVRGLTGLTIRDTQNGFKLLPTSVARELTSVQLCEGLAFDVEMLARAQAAGLRTAEVPVTYRHDPRSRVRVATASPRMLLDVARVAVRVRADRRSRPKPRREAPDRL